MIRKFAIIVIGLMLMITGCSPARTQVLSQTAVWSPIGVLTPYRTETPQPATATVQFELIIPETPSPTPTPFLHVVTNDDTMLGLALRYGVKLEDLKAANPGVNPNAMSVGSKLIIPINGVISEYVPTPTALPVLISQPRCIETGDSGAWCIIPIQNDTGSSLENLSAWVGIYNSQGENLISQVAYAPLNILQPGDTIPLMAFFPPPLPIEYTVRSEVLSALPVASDDPRYLLSQVDVRSVEIYPGGNQARVNGVIVLPPSTKVMSQVWVLVVAYDTNGEIVGVRKWKSTSDTYFDTMVYSLGGEIDHVELLTEVKP